MTVNIRTEFIKLDQLLKYAGVADSGAFAKELILEGFVSVNGEIETRRGRKIRPNDKISIAIPEVLHEEIVVEQEPCL